MKKNPDMTRSYSNCNNCYNTQLTPDHIYSYPSILAALYMADINPEENIHTDKASHVQNIVASLPGFKMDKLKKACETKRRTFESVIAEADGELGKQEPSLEMLMSLRPKLLRCKDRFLIASDCLIEQLIKADGEDEEIEDVDIVQANLFGRSEGVLQKMEQLLAKPTVDRESIVSGTGEQGPPKESGTGEQGPTKESGTGEKGPTKKSDTCEREPTKEPGTGEKEPTKESGTGERGPTKESGTGGKEPTKESGTGEKEPTKEPGTGEKEPTKESGTGEQGPTKESGTGEREPTKESGTGEKEPTEESVLGNKGLLRSLVLAKKNLLRSLLLGNKGLLWSLVLAKKNLLRSLVLGNKGLLRSLVLAKNNLLRSLVLAKKNLLRSLVLGNKGLLRSLVLAKMNLLRSLVLGNKGLLRSLVLAKKNLLRSLVLGNKGLLRSLVLAKKNLLRSLRSCSSDQESTKKPGTGEEAPPKELSLSTTWNNRITITRWLGDNCIPYTVEPLEKPDKERYGAGRYGILKDPITLGDAIDMIKMHVINPAVSLTIRPYQDTKLKVKSVAVCAGSGASVLMPCPPVDLMVTGEISHHDALELMHRGTYVQVQLLMARSRVAPMKNTTIPRLELVACEIGSRLAVHIKSIVEFEDIPITLWTDSTTALAWIKRDMNWSVFVAGRVKKIRQNSSITDWRHVPGKENPADIPSRGASISQLITTRWWEGPVWPKKDEQFWTQSEKESIKEVNGELRGAVVKHFIIEKQRNNGGSRLRFGFRVIAIDPCLSLRRVFEWYKRFKEGREETADNERSGMASTSATPGKVDTVLELSSEWRFKNEPRPKKARKAPSKVKVMLTVFFDYQGIVHHEFQQQGSTITADSYLGVLRRLREAIRQKRPELWRSKSGILHHDKAPAHTALKISKFLRDHSTSVFPQPPNSPDLAPCDFYLFRKLKKKVIGSEISEHRTDQNGIEEGHEGDPENRLPEVFCRLEKKVMKCIAANGDFFEEDIMNPPPDKEGVFLYTPQFRAEEVPIPGLLV
ncbi:hypothetical protein LAZ67_5004357 [Cordylochernes scorpioides]|uniref:Uncharacterized protein n=1 Tax=Cordylochernes scorpioides TaxID=51811 RepID=A0ABY6KI91_9ARAC|nr:hypothetical protein LAZ67_5004357 [Cordylochernes scorpioides]